MTWPALHVSRPVDADVASVVAVAGDPARLPEWAAGVSSGIRLDGGRWLSDSPMGAIEIAFTGPRELGILDHDVTLPDGTVVRNPLRVLPNADGSEVVFTLFQRPGVSDEALAADAALVAADLDRLAALVARA
ncbi:polyketide cyclase [Clavibacter michiganensis]|uniref:Polyketide cyclase n=1 Tax=Clavibacter michiganensis TaxID=28447 RepID=A0A2S5VT75_9MICO|nr:polyketide cyclase [Clavibacter michiganensis]PPF52390.1 polyketide cyclase [Clavibacter michiganensis]PPF67386.1 polyketide cyclase [Clavibacter michiganensis]